jgi:tRNA U38,U39,U40 pseudouridine synthase TruA
MPTYRLLIEYDGTKFGGWQVQAHGRTVQGVLLETLRTLAGERELDLQGAGRTDVAGGAAAFVGRHDFRAFAKRVRGAESTLVEVEACEVAPVGDFVLLRLVASHFLWNQVRRMVGTLVAIGRGDAAPGDVPGWLSCAAQPPLLAAPSAGLFLEAVRYPDQPWELPALDPVGVPWMRGRPAKC